MGVHKQYMAFLAIFTCLIHMPVTIHYINLDGLHSIYAHLGSNLSRLKPSIQYIVFTFFYMSVAATGHTTALTFHLAPMPRWI